MTAQLLLAAGTFIQNQERKVLLLKDKSSNLWGPPAGHWEPGETLEEVAIRETKEETNLDVKVDGLVQAGVLNLPDGRVYIACFYKAKALNLADIKIQEAEILEYTWATKDDIIQGKYEFRKKFLGDIFIRAFDMQPVPAEVFQVINTE